MKQIIGQLEQLRRSCRLLLSAHCLLQWLTTLALTILLCGVLDYTLRLPGYVRLILDLLIVATAVVWPVVQLTRALGFGPDLSVLAQRAERLFPQVHGELASAVDFAAHPEHFADPQLTARLAQESIAQVQRKVPALRATQLLDLRLTVRYLCAAGLALVVFSGIVLACPTESLIAAQRWTLPLGQTQWPRRTTLRSLFARDVWPDDTPLGVTARVERGYRQGMRTWVVYRVESAGQSDGWQRLLMNQQAAAPGEGGGRSSNFERLIDLPELLGRRRLWSNAAAATSTPESYVEFYFEAGDDQTAVQSVRLVRRPAVESVRVQVQPPNYAAGLAPAQEVVLDQQSGPVATAAALEGSAIRLRLELNKPLPMPQGSWRQVLEGLPPESDLAMQAQFLPQTAGGPPTLEFTFTLRSTVQVTLRLVDENGLSNQSERLYRLEAVADKQPVVALVEPPADESVLPAAKVSLEASARDDVGIENLWIEAAGPAGASASTENVEATGAATAPADQAATAPAASDNAPPGPVRQIAQISDRRGQLSLRAQLDLAPLALQVGDELVLTAVTRDVYNLDGQQHPPVRSAWRRLRIIDTAAMIGQIRSELSGLRQQVMRLADRQQQLQETAPGPAQPRQQEMSRNLNTQVALVDKLEERLERNDLHDPQLDQLLGRVGELLQQSQDSSQSAAQKLSAAQADPQDEKALSSARQEQQQVSQKLTDLAALLDQGQDALTLQLQLRQLSSQQKALAGDTREMMPKTAGQNPEDLTPQDRQALEELANRQAALSQQAQTLSQQMQQAAGNMQQDQSADQAVAAALAEAAAIAQRQNLGQVMQQAAEQARSNRLSQAGAQQQASAEILEQMLQQLQDQEQRRQEVLRRELMQLAQQITELITQQKGQMQLLELAKQLLELAPQQTTLRRNTLAVQEKARASPAAAGAVQPLGRAVDHQAGAVDGLRQENKPDAQAAQTRALGALEEALKLVQQAQQAAESEKARQQRAELLKAYQDLAQQQEELRKQTQPLSSLPQLTRPQRGQLIELGHRQADLRSAVIDLKQKVEQTLLFSHLHREIEGSAGQVVSQLHSAQADQNTLQRQQDIARMLSEMAQALREQPDEEPFARNQQGESEGGGGGGGGNNPVVPPLAELKLLRSLQQNIAQDTRTLSEAAGAAPADKQHEHRLLQLSSRQRELSGLGQQLIEQAAKQMQHAPGGEGQEPQEPPQPQRVPHEVNLTRPGAMP